jgi:hypothetical protein
MNLPPPAVQVTSSQRLTAILDSNLRRLHSYFQYIGLAKFGKAISALQTMQEIKSAGCSSVGSITAVTPRYGTNKIENAFQSTKKQKNKRN